MSSSTPAPHLSKATRALLALIPELSEPQSQRQLADRLGCNPMTVNRAVQRLVTLGFVQRERRDDGWRAHQPDRLTVTSAGQAYTDLHSGSRDLQRNKNQVQALPPEVEQLRSAMRAAGLTAGFGNLYPEVVDELVTKVRQLGVATLVRAAVAQTWGAVRHVAAYLARWRELRPPRPTRCPFHPAHPPHGCPECAERKAKAVPMPSWLRDQFRTRRQGAHVAPPTPVPLLSA